MYRDFSGEAVLLQAKFSRFSSSHSCRACLSPEGTSCACMSKLTHSLCLSLLKVLVPYAIEGVFYEGKVLYLLSKDGRLFPSLSLSDLQVALFSLSIGKYERKSFTRKAPILPPSIALQTRLCKKMKTNKPKFVPLGHINIPSLHAEGFDSNFKGKQGSATHAFSCSILAGDLFCGRICL